MIVGRVRRARVVTQHRGNDECSAGGRKNSL